MKRVLEFNTTGPCNPGEHYMLPPERRLGDVLDLIERHKYFTLTAGRQTGKTTSLKWLERYLPTKGWRALWLDVETAGGRAEPGDAFSLIMERCERALQIEHDGLRAPKPERVTEWLARPGSAIVNCFAHLAAQDPRPLAILIDEADSLAGNAMVSFLTQLRDGYIGRDASSFPASIALVGLRSVRDYPLTTEERLTVRWLGTSSPFNISAEGLTLVPFTSAEVAELLEQHTAATGQRFEPEAVDRIWDLGRGHPWLTNALADQIVRHDVRDRSVAVTAAHVDAAKETIILARRTHIDSLMARLREPRIRRILEPMLVGERLPADLLDDDVAYVVGHGLVTVREGLLEIANPIYREVIPRVLTYVQQISIARETASYVRPDGGLDVRKLLTDWQVFWRKDGHLSAEGFHYREAGPHLMLMAFLQRIVNGGGRVEREYGLGRGALDLMIFWGNERHAIEVKLRRDTETEAEALEQVAAYLDRAGLGEGWLIMFDLRKELAWADKLFVREAEQAGKTIRIVGC